MEGQGNEEDYGEEVKRMHMLARATYRFHLRKHRITESQVARLEVRSLSSSFIVRPITTRAWERRRKDEYYHEATS